MRFSRALLTRVNRANASAHYRVDFFAVVPRQGVYDESEPTTWAVVDRMYIEDAQAPEVLEWARRRAGGGRFAAYVEHRVTRNETDLLVVSLIAGEDPTPPPYRTEVLV